MTTILQSLGALARLVGAPIEKIQPCQISETYPLNGGPYTLQFRPPEGCDFVATEIFASLPGKVKILEGGASATIEASGLATGAPANLLWLFESGVVGGFSWTPSSGAFASDVALRIGGFLINADVQIRQRLRDTLILQPYVPIALSLVILGQSIPANIQITVTGNEPQPTAIELWRQTDGYTANDGFIIHTYPPENRLIATLQPNTQTYVDPGSPGGQPFPAPEPHLATAISYFYRARFVFPDGAFGEFTPEIEFRDPGA